MLPCFPFGVANPLHRQVEGVKWASPSANNSDLQRSLQSGFFIVPSKRQSHLVLSLEGLLSFDRFDGAILQAVLLPPCKPRAIWFLSLESLLDFSL